MESHINKIPLGVRCSLHILGMKAIDTDTLTLHDLKKFENQIAWQCH